MKIRFGLDIDIDMEDVEVEGNSIEDCKNKLFQMSVQEMLEAGGYVKNYTIDDVDYVSITCPETAEVGEEISCSIAINVATFEAQGFQTNTTYSEGVSFVSFETDTIILKDFDSKVSNNLAFSIETKTFPCKINYKCFNK